MQQEDSFTLITVQLFAKARELVGNKSSVTVKIPSQQDFTFGKLWRDIILEQIPELSAVRESCVLAVNDEYVDPESHCTLKQGDEVAVIPPICGVSSGLSCCCEVSFTNGAVAYSEAVTMPMGAGAECTFLGRTREEIHAEHGKLTMLRYEAHESMALKMLQKIGDEAGEKYNLLHVRIIHSLGEVPVGQASILVQCYSAHRLSSFQATQEIMDRLKQLAPIWKQEVWEKNETWQDGKMVNREA